MTPLLFVRERADDRPGVTMAFRYLGPVEPDGDREERPITIEHGTNTLVPRDASVVLRLVDEILASGGKRGRTPELWDGHAAGRIAEHLAGWLAQRSRAGVSA